MRAEGEGSNHAEVASASTAQGPEEVGIVVRVASEQAAVSQDDLCREQIVAGQAELATKDTDATSKCQASDAHSGTRASRKREAMLCKCRVDVDQTCSCSHRSRSGTYVHIHCIHAAHVEY